MTEVWVDSVYGEEYEPEEEFYKAETSGNLLIVNHIISAVGATVVAYSDDLEYLGVGQEDGSIQLYKKGVKNKLLIDVEMKTVREPVTDLKIKSTSKAGYHRQMLASYLSGHIKLWDIVLGKCLFTIMDLRYLFCINYHPRNKRFVTAGLTPKISVYDEDTKIQERVLAASEAYGSTNGHTDAVCCAMFHPRNNFILYSSGVDRTLQIWDLRAPYSVGCINVDNCVYGDTLDVSYSGDEVLICVGDFHCSVRVWDIRTCEVVKLMRPGRGVGLCARWLTPSKIGVASYVKNAFRLIDSDTCQVIGELSELDFPVTSFTMRRPVPQFCSVSNELPQVALCSRHDVYEVGWIPEKVTTEESLTE